MATATELITCGHPLVRNGKQYGVCNLQVRPGTPRCAAKHPVRALGQNPLFDTQALVVPPAEDFLVETKQADRIPEQPLSEWVAAAGLDYEVDKRPVHTQNDRGDMVMIPDRYSVFRKDLQLPLGDVGRVWTPAQPQEVVEFATALEQSTGARVANGGYYRNGAHMWIAMRLAAQDANVLGDPITAAIRLTNDYDGRSSLSIYVTPIHERSGLQLGCSVDDLAYVTHIRHTNSIEQRLQEAAEKGEQSVTALAAFADRATAMAQTPFSGDRMVDLVKRSFENIDEDEKAVAMADEINAIRRHNTTILDSARDTNWGAYLAVVLYYRNRWAGRDEVATDFSELRGAQARTRQKAFVALRPPKQ